MLQVIPHVVGLFALCAEFTCCPCTKLIHFLTCTGIPCRGSHCESGRVRCCLYTGCPSLHKHDCAVTHPNFVESILCVSHNICNASPSSSPRTPRVASPSYLEASSLADRACSTFVCTFVNCYLPGDECHGKRVRFTSHKLRFSGLWLRNHVNMFDV